MFSMDLSLLSKDIMVLSLKRKHYRETIALTCKLNLGSFLILLKYFKCYPYECTEEELLKGYFDLVKRVSLGTFKVGIKPALLQRTTK